MNKLKNQLNQIEANIANQDMLNTAISGANVGWHIEHLLLTMNMIIEQVKKSDPSKFKSSFKLGRLVIFTIGIIPRGRAKSPKIVKPKTYDENSLKSHLEIAKSNIQTLQDIAPNKFFSHPYFGDLKLNKTIRFLEIHNNHHLKIIRDILKSKN